MSLLPLSTSSASKNNPSLCRRANTRFSNTSGRRLSYISCNQQPSPESNPNNGNKTIDRRNVLLGLSGVYGATATLGGTAFAKSDGKPGGKPVQPPNLKKCHPAIDTQFPDGDREVECCPPKYENTTIVDFKPPDFTQLRTRRPAHKLDSEYIAKFEEAIRRMKDLPEDDPWNFYQQAQIHCAFCNNAFYQAGYEDKSIPLQVHFGFLFFPWHRFYLYFWEKILGNLINDPTFAVPFWNWDTPSGMFLPSIYTNENSTLYNDNRNKEHYKALLDYKYKYGDPNPTPEQRDAVTLSNLLQLQTIFAEGKRTPKLFMGGPDYAGEKEDNDQGALEALHNTIHQWAGPVAKPNWDMGNFHTAARDTVFWGLHGNVDRMWHLLTTFRGYQPEFKEKAWLDAAFVFYDDNRQLVRCKVRDCLNIAKLGYAYEIVELPWLDARRSYIKQQRKREKRGDKPRLIDVGEFGLRRRLLALPIRVLVPRPKPSLTKDDKEEVSEVLTIEDIVITDEKEHQRFDVYVAKPINGKATSDLGEFAGAFTYIPISSGKTKKTFVLNLGLTSLVENLEADSSEYLVVSLIPGVGEVTIGGVKIGLLDIDDGDDE